MLYFRDDFGHGPAAITLSQQEALGAKLAPERAAPRRNCSEGPEWAVVTQVHQVIAGQGKAPEVGQYLRPTAAHAPMTRYYHPDEFAEMKVEALELGFRHVESGPLVRSSYHARDQVPGAELRRQRRRATIDDQGRIVPGGAILPDAMAG